MLVAARPQMQTAMKYALVEMTPPKIGDIPAIRSGKRSTYQMTSSRYFSIQSINSWIHIDN